MDAVTAENMESAWLIYFAASAAGELMQATATS